MRWRRMSGSVNDTEPENRTATGYLVAPVPRTPPLRVPANPVSMLSSPSMQAKTVN